ncbi:hypothetical protein LPJ61_000828 [Coemansia biformis]|uniref:BZIP domain-containing protein n=1 Tax=Coemansia biformis TaxID=1286918 RepID=A0A9W7YIV9_9FUNG|nr:hypothetical protein LPJ61_000828 [Coemansia biformis]
MSTNHMYTSYGQPPQSHWAGPDQPHHMPQGNRTHLLPPPQNNRTHPFPPPRQGEEPKRHRNSQESVGSDKACSSDEAARILEERRRRNANASARFRKRRNERERELALRCVYLENQLQQSLGPAAFEATMRHAPPVERSLLTRHSQGGGYDDDDESPSPVSVCALTAPKSIDDVWSAYLQLSEQIAGAVERIDVLESK